jgi:hypothetical protein
VRSNITGGYGFVTVIYKRHFRSFSRAIHHFFEFSQGDDTVSVIVTLRDNFFDFFVHLLVVSQPEHLSNLFERDGA